MWSQNLKPHWFHVNLIINDQQDFHKYLFLNTRTIFQKTVFNTTPQKDSLKCQSHEK